MQFKVALITLLSAIGSVVAQAADPSINTPSGVVQCLPVQFTFSGTAPPFFVTIQPGGQASAAALVSFEPTSSTSITWVANIAAGTSLTLVIRDSQGRTNPSAPFTILEGSDSSCLNASATTGGTVPASADTASATGSSAATSAAQTSAAVTTTATTRATGSSSHASSASSAAAAATSSNAASSMKPMGFAGLIGLVGAAVLA